MHGLPALAQFADNKWLDIGMIRMNHRGVRMDTPVPDANELGDVKQVVGHMTKMLQRLLGETIILSFKPPPEVPLILGAIGLLALIGYWLNKYFQHRKNQARLRY